MAPITADKILEAVRAMEDDMDLVHDDSILPPSGELIPNSYDSDDDDDSRDDFDKEVRFLMSKLTSVAFSGH